MDVIVYFPPKKNRKAWSRTQWAILASAFWISITIGISWVELRAGKMEANEWGDFLSGFFSPLAFFWLIMGYLQQGEELNQNTEALKMQAKELANSVAHQSELVMAAKEEIEIIKANNQESRRMAQPTLIPQAAMIEKIGFNSGTSRVSMSIQHSGNPIYEVNFICHGIEFGYKKIAILRSGTGFNITKEGDFPDAFFIKVTYKDIYKESQTGYIKAERKGDTLLFDIMKIRSELDLSEEEQKILLMNTE